MSTKKRFCIIIASPAGVGKTCIAGKYKNVLDIAPGPFSSMKKEIGNEESKNIEYTNPDWPHNYLKEINKQRTNYDIILVAFLIEILKNPDFLRLLKYYGIDFRAAIPNLSAIDAIIKRMEKRGNNSEFIRFYQSVYPDIIKEFSKPEYDSIIIQDNEYLEDALIRNKLLSL